MANEKRDSASGAALTFISIMKNRKVTSVIGGAMMAIGIAGMIMIGSEALSTILGGGYDFRGQGTAFQIGQYAFMFPLIAGLIIVIYSQIARQANNSKKPRRL